MQYIILTLASVIALSGNIQAPIISSSVNSPTQSSITRDTRADRIDAYFEARSMPLAGFGEKFVEEADRCGLDWRLLPAIGVRESSGGKRLMNNNPFGWGSAKIYFANFDEAIEVVTSNLCGENQNTARYYADNDYMTKLYWFNGTVLPSYPAEVEFIMEMIEETEV